jgi:hypothetical protein
MQVSEPRLVPSEDFELMTTKPHVAVAPIEEPDVEIEMVDEWPEVSELPPLPTCLPRDAGARFAVDGTALRACWNRGGDFTKEPDVCLWVAADGNAWTDAPPAAAPAEQPTVTVAADSMTARLCAPGVECRSLAPVLTEGRTIQQAVVDEEGTRVALLLHDDGAAPATVELYDAATGAWVAAGTRNRRRAAVAEHEIAFVGQAILWIEQADDDEHGQAELWKTKRDKLKLRKKVRGPAGEWANLGGGRFVVTDESTRAQVWDAKKARRVAKLDVKELAGGSTEDRDSMLITGTRGAFSLVVLGRTAGRVAFVDGWTRRPRPTVVDIPVCE